MRSNDHGSSDDTRSRGTGRVHGGAAPSAQQAGTVNAAEVFGSVGSTGTGGRPLADDHVLLAEWRGGKGSARCGLQRQPFLCGVAHHRRLHGPVRLHSDALFPLGVARLPRPRDFPGELFSDKQSKKISRLFSGDDNDT